MCLEDISVFQPPEVRLTISIQNRRLENQRIVFPVDIKGVYRIPARCGKPTSSVVLLRAHLILRIKK